MNAAQNILVIDVETTGLDPSRHACIEIGAVMLDKSLRPKQEFSSLIVPWDGAEIIEAAMKVNQISVEQLDRAPLLDEVVKQFHETFRPDEAAPLLAGWNVWFDAHFLRDLYQRTQRAWPFTYRLLDVQSIVSFHSMLADLSQEKAIETFLNERQAHRALADAQHTARLLRLMAERYAKDLVNDARHV